MPTTTPTVEDAAYLQVLADGTRAEAAQLLGRFGTEVPELLPHRETMRAVKVLVLGDVLPGAPDERTREVTTRLLDHLDTLQGPTGLFDGDNLVSPPDSAFTINDLCLTLEVLRGDDDHRDDEVVQRLEAVARRAVDALVRGGVHTPNHRWELASALAGLHDVVAHPGLLPRVDEWLAEGIDIDPDGLYSERSPNYAAYVTNPSLMTIARVLDRPALLDHVRRNLRATLALVDDDGEVETVQSRRQDQAERFGAHAFLSQLRWFAVHDHDGDFARVVGQVLSRGVPDASRHLAEALVDPVLRGQLPPPVDVVPGMSVLRTSGLVRVRTDRTSLTVFGGSDHRRTGRIASGLANSSTVVRLRHGGAQLRALRLSPEFFGTGAFRPDALDVDDGVVRLAETRTSGYYGPLAPEHRSSDGAYQMTDEGRFFAEMSFDLRERSELALGTTVTVAPVGDDVELDVQFDGVRTRYALELVFDEPGVLDGVEAHPTVLDATWLRGPRARFIAGPDVIEVYASGHDSRLPPRFDEGEIVTYVGGHDLVPGIRMLLGGWTDEPLHLQIKPSREDTA